MLVIIIQLGSFIPYVKTETYISSQNVPHTVVVDRGYSSFEYADNYTATDNKGVTTRRRINYPLAVVQFLLTTATAVLVCYLLYKREVIFEKNENTIEDPYALTPDFSQRIISMSDELSDILIHKNLGKYLMSDCDFPRGIIHTWHSAYQLRETLTPIMKGLLIHLGLPQIVDLHIELKNKNTNTAGNYFTKNIYSKTITLCIDSRQSDDSILATLCHECTHFFMEYHNLKISDEKENEIRTDIYSNLIGFNLLMIRGYEPYNNIKIGYISSDDCSDIYNYLTYKRKILNVIDEIRNNASTAELLYEQVTSLYNDAVCSKQSKATRMLINSFQKFSQKDIPNMINACKTVHTRTRIANEIIRTNNMLYELCTDMSKYIYKFQSDKYRQKARLFK